MLNGTVPVENIFFIICFYAIMVKDVNGQILHNGVEVRRRWA